MAQKASNRRNFMFEICSPLPCQKPVKSTEAVNPWSNDVMVQGEPLLYNGLFKLYDNQCFIP